MSLIIPDRNYNQRIFRDFSKKFTDQYPSFHEYVAHLKLQKNAEYKNFLAQRQEFQREQEMANQEKMRREQEREKMMRIMELEEKIKQTKKKIKDHDEGIKRRQQEELNKKLVVVNEYITKKAKYYEDARKYQPRIPGTRRKNGGDGASIGGSIQRRATFEDETSEVNTTTHITEVGLQSTPYHDYKVKMVTEDKKKLQDMEKVIHEAKMIPKKSLVGSMNRAHNNGIKKDKKEFFDLTSQNSGKMPPKKALGQ